MAATAAPGTVEGLGVLHPLSQVLQQHPMQLLPQQQQLLLLAAAALRCQVCMAVSHPFRGTFLQDSPSMQPQQQQMSCWDPTVSILTAQQQQGWTHPCATASMLLLLPQTLEVVWG